MSEIREREKQYVRVECLIVTETGKAICINAAVENRDGEIVTRDIWIPFSTVSKIEKRSHQDKNALDYITMEKWIAKNKNIEGCN
jgi:hypothetical protein